ncbi:unnamed protein product [Adineta steineri]|uniref:Uncharacterized protein n=1 Tax=Adineta steineri TaxID=433720 RepID=A0A819Z7X3_9BILA|nr:unnamed protein product [Adineta steineri]CAF4169893.1 unnamed protein product [Adineta steineri]CAF4198769.1 unnamed protein product [Adineta steineri]
MDLNNCDPIMIQKALDSLIETHIETLAVKIVGIPEERYRSYGLNLAQFFQLPTVKKLTFATNVGFPHDFFDNVIKPSNIEYFTFADPEINFGDFSLLVRLMPNLKYLNIHLTSAQYSVRRWREVERNKPFPLMSMMKTYIVHVHDGTPIDFDRLVHHLKAMPALLQLEVTAPHGLFNAQNWEGLITSSLMKLVHLRLYATSHPQDPETIVQITDAFKTPFWVKKTNFVFMLMQLVQHKKAREQSETIERLGRASFNIYAYQFWTGAVRSDRFLQNPMVLTGEGNNQIYQRKDDYFYYVEHIDCQNMDQPMVDWFKGHVNCLKIKHFEGRYFCKGTELSIFTNLRTVRLPPKALAALTNDKSQVFSTVQYLDLRDEKELFHSECIEQIRELFPNVEHLVFNTESLDCVPNLACCLPRLRSLTCMMHDQDLDWEPGSIRYHLNKWSQSLRRKCDLFFCREEDFLIIWLDKASIENTRWHTFRTKQTSEKERQRFAALFDAPNSEDTSDADENNYYGRQDRKRRRYQPHPNDLFFDEYDYDT